MLVHCVGEPRQLCVCVCVCAFVRLEQLVVTVLDVFLDTLRELLPGEKLLESRNHQRVWHG